MPAPRAWISEVSGWLVATAASLITVTFLTGGPRGDVLFRDGDAVLPLLIAHSLQVGQAQDWALSSVLFIPELAVFLPLSWLGLANTVTLALAGVVWFTLLYGAIRLVSGRRAGGGSPVLAAGVAHALFCAIALTETSTSRDALDLSSLLASSTYYAATVVACVASVGLVWRWMHGRRRLLLVLLAVLAAASVFTNPLYAVWGIFPFLVIGFAVFRGAMLWPALALVAPGLISLAARSLTGDTIVLSGFGYIQPMNAGPSFAVFLTGFLDRLNEPAGILVVALTAALMIVAVVVMRRATADSHRFIAGIAGVAPVLVLVAMIAMGADATRYLQPFAFYPVLLLTLLRSARASIMVGAVAAGASLVAAGIVTAAGVRAEHDRVDADLACVVAYANVSSEVGAGQYWSIRLPKSAVDDPRDLIQVDHALQAYPWLVNRADYTDVAIGYLVVDDRADRDARFAPADPNVLAGATELPCGRYTIIDLVTPVPITATRAIG